MGVLTPEVRLYVAGIPRNERDELTPEAVVEAARDEASPLHGYFEWDDASAAHAHRLHQARVLIKGWRITVEHEERVISVPMYVESPDKPSGAQGYVTFDKLRREPDTAQRALQAEIDRAAGVLSRARTMAIALGMEDELEASLNGLSLFRERVQQLALPAA
jgi:hypothetical protein